VEIEHRHAAHASVAQEPREECLEQTHVAVARGGRRLHPLCALLLIACAHSQRSASIGSSCAALRAG
jgi:hypothetical protein